ncbi:LAQU0S16e00716g1_1 [Lachancea quebecensis]|uniref:LAQU0S16e00716g1_1 n=1 Tax=Lachancea quebecensis TaxID=1654605 RepID=A0A0N7MM85_9SACH|nr:LAQU0S16e00716g1_1 [Lachancea quebecensis]
MDNQFIGGQENQEQDEYLNFLDPRPLQENTNALTPQVILARSTMSSAASPNVQSVSPASMFSPMAQSQPMPTASPQQVLNAGATPQQVLTQAASSQQVKNQAPTPQAILSNHNTPQMQEQQLNNSSATPNNAFADRAAMFAALQQRQQQQRQKLQMMQQATPRASSPQSVPHQRPSVGSQSQPSPVGQVPQTQGSSGANMPHLQQRQAIQNLDPEIQRRVSGELNNKQYELFMKSLIENCKRRNAPLHALPEIQGRRVNLFVLYMMVQKLGGGESVTRFQQWPMLVQKLQLPQDSSQQLATLYYHILLPYEQYLASPEGIKETQSKRLFLQQFLQELLKKILGTHSNIQPDGPAGVPTNTQTSPQVNVQSNIQTNETNVSSYSTPNSTDMQDPNKVRKPRKPKVKKKSKKDLEREMKYQQEQLQKQHQFQQEQQSKLIAEQRFKQQQEQLRLQQQQALRQNLEYQKLPKVYKRSFARNYVPFTRPIETSNGYDIRAISQIGEKIDANKPVFLFAPELGTINLHALSLSLLSDCLSETNVALNILLVTSADAVLKISLEHSEGLVDSLTILGCRILSKLCLPSVSSFDQGSGYLKEYDVDNMLDRSTTYSEATATLEAVYKKTVYEKDGAEELKIKVDSLTGVDLEQAMLTPEQTPLDSTSPDRGDEEFEDNESSQNEWDYLPEPLWVSDNLAGCNLNVTSYLSSLRYVRDEVDTIFTKVNERGAENPQLLLVDQLSTISMILRNLSFNEANTSFIANSVPFKRFLSDLMWALLLRNDKFVFHRKCLNFKKDTIITLANIAHIFKLENHVSAFLLLLLIISLGEKSVELGQEDSLKFPENSVQLSKYQSFGVDVLAKILSLGYPNRFLIKSVLLQQFEPDSQSQDVETCQKLLELYESTATQSFGKLSLLNDIFASLISIVPFQQLNMSPTLIEDASPIISQSITALLSLVRLIKKEDMPSTSTNLPLLWLTSEENIGSSLRRLSEALSNIGIHTNNNLSHLKLLFNSISTKSLQLVCLLIEKSLELATQNDNTEQGPSYLAAAKELNGIPNLLPSEPNAFSLLTNPMADFGVATGMGILYRLRNQLIGTGFQQCINVNVHDANN